MRDQVATSARFFRKPLHTEIDENLPAPGPQIRQTIESIFMLSRPEASPSERRDQLSASASQNTRLAGSCMASCLHSKARERSSNGLAIGAPCLGFLLAAAYDGGRSRDYCPDGHCPNGHVSLIERSRARVVLRQITPANARDRDASDYLICIKLGQIKKLRQELQRLQDFG